jgi:type III secretion system low calcium response chaperone LcrH/SycD
MKGEEQEVRRAAQAIGEGLGTAEMAGTIVNVMDKLLKTGVMPREELGYNEERMEEIYGQAYRLYNTGKYVDALELFRLLIILDSTDSKYYLGLAACFHMLKEYENAVKVYAIAGIVDSQSPVPHFHASDCYLQMNDKASAILMLELAVLRSGDKPEYQILKDRAQLTIDSIKKELIKLGALSE